MKTKSSKPFEKVNKAFKEEDVNGILFMLKYHESDEEMLDISVFPKGSFEEIAGLLLMCMERNEVARAIMVYAVREFLNQQKTDVNAN